MTTPEQYRAGIAESQARVAAYQQVLAAEARIPYLNEQGHACTDSTPVKSQTVPHDGPWTSRHQSGAVCVGRMPEVPADRADLHKRARLLPAEVQEPVHDHGWGVRVAFQPMPGLDRTDGHAWGTGDGPTGKRLAERLARAIDAGAVISIEGTYIDVGRRIGIRTKSAVMGRYLNADLKRLGY